TPRRRGRRAPRRRRSRTRRPAGRGGRARAATGGGRARRRPGGAPSRAHLALEPRPGLLPLRVVHAVVLPVAAVGDRGLPEVDLLEVRERRVGVVLLARALRELVHPRAGLA